MFVPPALGFPENEKSPASAPWHQAQETDAGLLVECSGYITLTLILGKQVFGSDRNLRRHEEANWFSAFDSDFEVQFAVITVSFVALKLNQQSVENCSGTVLRPLILIELESAH